MSFGPKILIRMALGSPRVRLASREVHTVGLVQVKLALASLDLLGSSLP